MVTNQLTGANLATLTDVATGIATTATSIFLSILTFMQNFVETNVGLVAFVVVGGSLYLFLKRRSRRIM